MAMYPLNPSALNGSALGIALFLTAGSTWAIPQPLVELRMNEGTGNTVANSGSIQGAAVRKSTTKPSWTTKVPVSGGSAALDFGTTSNALYALDLGNIAALKNLKSFTITGWVNAKSATTGAGGNRIVSWINDGGPGVDLAFQCDGSIQLGINEWNDWAGIRSNGGKVTIDQNANFNNWRFFAVTYNSTLTSDHVRFYFGSNGTTSDLDAIRYYPRGTTGNSIADSLTIGHHNTSSRAWNTTQMFRGLIDEIRVYGSAANGSGALTASEIAEIQSASLLTGQGILYEEWTGVNGTTVEDLISHPEFPGNPSATMVRPSFDAFLNRGDYFGVRMSGWIKAPETGNYTFWIESDDNGELRLSTDANPVNKRIIASVSGYTAQYEWTKYTSQTSSAIPLTAGQYYYIEALMKEGAGADHIAVGWQLPSGTQERPIPAGRTFLTPGEEDGMFPSTVHLYESGTSTKKATMGWHKESSKNHYYLTTEGAKKLIVHNDVVNLPAKKLFFGELGEQNDLGFRYDRPTENGSSTLFLETDMGNWAMKVKDGGNVASPPYVEFNQRLWLTGLENEGESVGARLEHRTGLTQFKDQQFLGGDHREQSSVLNSEGLSFSETYTDAGGTDLSATYVNAGTAEFTSNILGEGGTTSIEGGTVTADIVVTRKWRVPTPDYVFERGYKKRSLEEVERFVRSRKHLPDIPSAKELEKDGMEVGEMNLRLLKTMEEMTLHMIEMNKELKRQKVRNDELERDLKALKGHGKGN